MTKTLTLGAFQAMSPTNLSGPSWIHPDSGEFDYLTLDYWLQVARRLEAGGFDFLFLADQYGYPLVDGEIPDVAVEKAMSFPFGDPFAVVSAMAAVTERLNFAVTASTVFDAAYSNARRFSTLDHLTGGRVGWNVVTSAGADAAAKMFGQPMLPHDRRYDLADDYIDLTYKLLESGWSEGAVRRDRAAGVYADPAGVHRVDHDGPFFSAHGVFPVEPSPQRVPTLFQAGSSGRGRAFAGRHAECVFLQGSTVDRVRDGVADIRAQAVAAGRGPQDVKVLVGVTVITGATTEEAAARHRELLSFSTDETAAAMYAWNTGIDLLSLDPDKPLPTVDAEQGRSNVERYQGDDAPTVREILDELKTRGLRGLVLVGTPEQVVEEIAAYVEQTDVDGFLIERYLAPSSYDALIDDVLPLLQERGMLPEPRRATSLRDRLFGKGDHLPATHPASAYRAPALEAAQSAAH